MTWPEHSLVCTIRLPVLWSLFSACFWKEREILLSLSLFSVFHSFIFPGKHFSDDPALAAQWRQKYCKLNYRLLIFSTLLFDQKMTIILFSLKYIHFPSFLIAIDQWHHVPAPNNKRKPKAMSPPNDIITTSFHNLDEKMEQLTKL